MRWTTDLNSGTVGLSRSGDSGVEVACELSLFWAVLGQPLFLTRVLLVSLTCMPSAMSIVKRLRASKISRNSNSVAFMVLEAVVKRSPGGVSALEPLSNSP